MKLTIFFGSGADTDFCSELPSGQDFAKALFTGEFELERKQLLGEDFGRFQLIYPTSRKVFLQTINEHPQEAEDVFEKSVIDQCRKYYDHYYGNGENQYDFFFFIFPVSVFFFRFRHISP